MINIHKILNSTEFDAVEKIELIKSVMATKTETTNETKQEETNAPKGVQIKRNKKPGEYSMTEIAIKRREEYLKKRLDPVFLQKRSEMNKRHYQKRKTAKITEK